MVVNAFKRINVTVQKAIMVFIVNFVRSNLISFCILYLEFAIFFILCHLLLTARCVIPCMNDGKCIGDNKCRCPEGLRGNHCEIGRHHRSTCKKPCQNGGICMPNLQCKCNSGWFGRYCNQRGKYLIKKSK